MHAHRKLTVHPIQMAKWRKSALAHLPELFVDGQLDKAAYDTLCAHERIRLESAEAETIRLEGQERTPELPTLQTVLLAFGGMSVSEAKRLKTLEAENGRLKKLVAELMLESEVVREALKKKW